MHTNEGDASLLGTVKSSAVSKNGGAFELMFYPENESESLLVRPEREGWSFAGWQDETGAQLLPEKLTEGETYYASWIDDVPPTLALVCTGNVAAYQEVTMLADDIAGDIGGYYAGVENPAETAVQYQQNENQDVIVKIEDAGKYYFSVQDSCGNVYTEVQEFVFVSFQVGEEEETSCERMLGRVGDTLQLPTASKKGHFLQGWLVQGMTEETVTPVKEHTFSEEVTFVPVFEANRYQVSLNGNGGTCETEKIGVTYGGEYPQLPEASRTGYHFQGWSKEIDGEVLQGGELYEVEGDSTLYAKWEPIRYTVRYMGNGNTGGEMGSIECVYDETFTHPRNLYTKQGYVFKGWSTSPGAISTQNALTARDRAYNGAEWLNEDEAVNITAESEAVVNLYAVWQKIEVGVMDYRYCMGQYMYFACTTLNYKTENAEDNGALFVGITPAGGYTKYGANATWATSDIRTSLNDGMRNDMVGLKLTNTTVNNSYSGNMWAYNPTKASPCTEADYGYGGKITRKALAKTTETMDYFFIPDLRDCFYYYTGNDWNWFWDMNLDGTPDTYPLSGMSESGPTDAYYSCINGINEKWSALGWSNRYWLRNPYTGYSNYPFYIAQYGVSACNPTYGEYATVYGNLASTGRYLIRPMYTMEM